MEIAQIRFFKEVMQRGNVYPNKIVRQINRIFSRSSKFFKTDQMGKKRVYPKLNSIIFNKQKRAFEGLTNAVRINIHYKKQVCLSRVRKYAFKNIFMERFDNLL